MRKLGAMVVQKPILILTFIFTHTYNVQMFGQYLKNHAIVGVSPK